METNYSPQHDTAQQNNLPPAGTGRLHARPLHRKLLGNYFGSVFLIVIAEQTTVDKKEQIWLYALYNSYKTLIY